MSDNTGLVRCVGCGVLVPESNGPTHRYIGASAGCWAVFGEVQVRGIDDVRYALRQMGVDAYAAQHPGVPSPQTIQSVMVHLISLCLQLEHGYTSEQGRNALTQAVQHKATFAWLDPPPSLGDLTILHIHDVRGPAAFPSALHAWTRSVWDAWAPHHATVRDWASRLNAPSTRRHSGR